MYPLTKLSLCAVILFTSLVTSTSPKHLNRRLTIDCKYCGPDALPRDYLWCSVDCKRPLGPGQSPGQRTKRSDANDCMQQCGPADVNCYKSCMGIPDSSNNAQTCMDNCDMLPTGEDYTHCTEACVTNTYMAAGADPTLGTAVNPIYTDTTTPDTTAMTTTSEITPEATQGTTPDATQETTQETIPVTTEMATPEATPIATEMTTSMTTPMTTVVWTMVPQTMTATVNGTTQYVTIQSMMMTSNPMAGDNSVTTDCPTIIVEYSSTMTSATIEASLVNSKPTGSLQFSNAEKQAGASYPSVLLTSLAGLVVLFAFGML